MPRLRSPRKLTPSDLASAHRDASLHRALVGRSKALGCFYCLRTFPPSAVEEWIDDGETALCPHCGIDAVLPDSVDLSEAFLKAMNSRWFSAD